MDSIGIIKANYSAQLDLVYHNNNNNKLLPYPGIIHRIRCSLRAPAGTGTSGIMVPAGMVHQLTIPFELNIYRVFFCFI